MACTKCGRNSEVERRRLTGNELLGGNMPDPPDRSEYHKVCGCTQFDSNGHIVENPEWPDVDLPRRH